VANKPRKVWKASFLPTHSHGLRDGVLFYLLASHFGFETWITALGCAAFLVIWFGELVMLGSEDQAIELLEFKNETDSRPK